VLRVARVLWLVSAHERQAKRIGCCSIAFGVSVMRATEER